MNAREQYREAYRVARAYRHVSDYMTLAEERELYGLDVNAVNAAYTSLHHAFVDDYYAPQAAMFRIMHKLHGPAWLPF
jgi:hypothetical protein